MFENTKAESLLFLKSIGLAPEPLLILQKLPKKEIFFDDLRKNGFKNGQEIGVRFSYTGIMEVPRSMGLFSFDEVYDFLKKYFRKGSAIIIHPFIKASYVGTLYFYENKLLINIIKSGIWEPMVGKNCDIFLIDDKKSKCFRYKKLRIVYEPKDKKLAKKIIEPLTKQEIKKLLKIFNDNQAILAQLDKFPNLILEFIITPKNKILGMELEHAGKNIDQKIPKEKDLLEINRYEDIKRWDKKKNLLLTLTIFRKDKDKFLHLINKIKHYKKAVFINYGLLSHPAILLREQGIKTYPYINNYEILNYKI
jgi:hypothetical protein